MAGRTPPKHLTWAERRAALRYIPPFLRLVWKTNAAFTVAMGLLRLARSFLPVLLLWIGKLIIDSVIGLRAHPGNLAGLWKLVAFEMALVVVGEALARASALIESLLG